MTESCLLYYITDRSAFPGDEFARRRRMLEKITDAARAGIDYIQLREKDIPSRELESLAREVAGVVRENRKLTPDPCPPIPALFINSRTDVAVAVGADGVHLRSDDVSPQEVKAVWQKCGAGLPRATAEGAHPRAASARDPVVAVSGHSAAEVAQAAANGASFVVFGPVFEKKDAPGAAPAGLALLKQSCEQKIPVLALGGVTLTNARSCLEAGAAGIAAIRLFQENDIAEVVRRLRAL